LDSLQKSKLANVLLNILCGEEYTPLLGIALGWAKPRVYFPKGEQPTRRNKLIKPFSYLKYNTIFKIKT